MRLINAEPYDGGYIVANKEDIGVPVKDVPTINTIYGYQIDEIARFAVIMRQLGIRDIVVKNFLSDAEHVYQILFDKFNDEIKVSIEKAMLGK